MIMAPLIRRGVSHDTIVQWRRDDPDALIFSGCRGFAAVAAAATMSLRTRVMKCRKTRAKLARRRSWMRWRSTFGPCAGQARSCRPRRSGSSRREGSPRMETSPIPGACGQCPHPNRKDFARCSAMSGSGRTARFCHTPGSGPPPVRLASTMRSSCPGNTSCAAARARLRRRTFARPIATSFRPRCAGSSHPNQSRALRELQSGEVPTRRQVERDRGSGRDALGESLRAIRHGGGA